MLRISIIIAVFLSVLLISCSQKLEPKEETAKAYYELGVELFNDEDYLEAKEMLEVVTQQYPASEYTDDAQFYISKIHYNRDEFILSAFNFNLLRKYYPGSVYGEMALYNSAMCYFELSPEFDRDQEYTNKAINAFQEFQYLYPDSDSLYKEAGNRIDELRNKLAHRSYFTAGLYRKMDEPKSALVYFEDVIANYSDTEYYEPAYFGKIQVFMLMNKYEQAESSIKVYKSLFPEGENLDEVKSLGEEIKELKGQATQ